MKAVLISIQPKWCEKIANGKKTIEVRKTKPKLETPFKVYIYCTKEKRKDDFITISGAFGLIRCPECAIYNRAKEYDCNGKVIGEFVCDRIENIFAQSRFWLNEDTLKSACLSAEQIWDYANGAEKIYGWHITDLKIYDKPKELFEFRTPEWFRDCEKACPAIERMRCPTNDSRKVDKMCGWCRGGGNPIARPPQSWCYVEVE